MQGTVMLTRLQPVGNLFNRFPRLVRDLARQLGKQIELVVEGTEVELDKTILESLSDPLTHMVRNCCDHGVEPPADRARAGKPPVARVRLKARHEGSQISISVADDGKGIDPEKIRQKAVRLGLRSREDAARLSEAEALALILLPGFSTAESVTDVSGRGVGMDVVKTNLDRLGGALEIESAVGHGTTFHLRLPLTVAIIPCLIVTAGGERYAVPQKDLEELVCLHPNGSRGRVEYALDQEVYRLRDRLLPIVRLSEVLNRRRPFTAATRAEIARAHREPAGDGLVYFAVVKAGPHRFGLVIDRILAGEEVVVKPMHPALAALKCFSGATIMGDGRVALILDIEGVARHAGAALDTALEAGRRAAPPAKAVGPTVLLFRAGPDEQFAVPLADVRRVEMLRAERLERVGGREFVTVEGVATPVLRLNDCLNVSPVPRQGTYYLLLPRGTAKPVGVLMSEVLDTAVLESPPSAESYHEGGVLGTATVRGRLTLVLDAARLEPRVGPAALPVPGKRVLVVDDTAFFRESVRNHLESAGYEVVTVSDGAEGLRQLEAGRFDAVVSDIEMPVMNGWDFAREARRRGYGLPMLALTTLAGDAERARAAECGFDGFEVKLDRDRLRAAVSALFSRAPQVRA
jgi:two-component system chemotaxis sensor kinase CheA